MSTLFCSEESISIYLMLNGEKEPDPSIPLLRYCYAYMGNLDLYLKVYNKNNIDEKEMLCIAEGCHENFEFARWCFNNIPATYQKIHKAISECFIKNNDFGYVRDDIYCIWCPRPPTEETLRQLYRLKPSLKYLIARACAVGDYVDLYKQLNVLPEVHVISEMVEYLSTEMMNFVVGKPICTCMCDITQTLYEKPLMNVQNQTIVTINALYDKFYEVDLRNITLDENDIYYCKRLSRIDSSKLHKKLSMIKWDMNKHYNNI